MAHSHSTATPPQVASSPASTWHRSPTCAWPPHSSLPPLGLYLLSLQLCLCTLRRLYPRPLPAHAVAPDLPHTAGLHPRRRARQLVAGTPGGSARVVPDCWSLLPWGSRAVFTLRTRALQRPRHPRLLQAGHPRLQRASQLRLQHADHPQLLPVGHPRLQWAGHRRFRWLSHPRLQQGGPLGGPGHAPRLSLGAGRLRGLLRRTLPTGLLVYPPGRLLQWASWHPGHRWPLLWPLLFRARSPTPWRALEWPPRVQLLVPTSVASSCLLAPLTWVICQIGSPLWR